MKILKSRLYQKKHDEIIKKVSSERKSQIGSGDRSDKIRTYNFPQDRVTDHRITHSEFGVESMLNGELLDIFTEALFFKEKIDKFEDLFGVSSNNSKKKSKKKK
jgi:peptide chain release factor 1